MYKFLFLFIFSISFINAQDAFTGNIDFQGTFWVRMMGYPATVPKWIKINAGTTVSYRATQGVTQSGDVYRQNVNGQMGAFYPSTRTWRVESDLIRPSVTNYKIQVLLIRDSRFEGRNVKPINHAIYSVYSANSTSTVPMAGNYVCIDDLVGGGSHYNFVKDPSNSTEIILYDNKHGSPGNNTGSYDSYGNWLKGTPIITNWKGANEPHVTVDKYEYDPKYTKYKSETYHDPVAGRKDDVYTPPPERLGDSTENNILGDLANIPDVEGCLDLAPLEPVKWNIDTYINEVNSSLIAKYDLSFFNTNVTLRELPDFEFELDVVGTPQTFVIAEDGKLNCGSPTATSLMDGFFSLARSIVLIFVGLYAITWLFAILRK